MRDPAALISALFNRKLFQEKALDCLSDGFPAVGKEVVRWITDHVEHDASILDGPFQRGVVEFRRRVNIQTSGNAQDWLF